MSIRHIAILAACLLCSKVYAQGLSPSPEQIERIKAMSPDAQKQLAASFGIKIPTITNTEQPQIAEPVITRAPIILAEPPAQEVLEKTTSLTNVQLKRFGQDIFASGAEAFLPTTDMPVPANYIMGPGDTLVVQLYGKENNTYSLTLGRGGQIQFPQIGPVGLAGLTFTQAQEAIKSIVSEQMIGIKSSVTMGALRSIRVFVLGDVKQPGSFTVGSLSTMTNALLASGGVTHIGSLRNIQLKRQGKLVNTLDLYQLLLKGDTSSDARLLPGDVIFVPPIKNLVSIAGEINRPAEYELIKMTNIGTLIKTAGGTTNNAYISDIQIERTTPSGEKRLISLDLNKRNNLSFPLKQGDAVDIKRVLDTVNEQVILHGHLKREGKMQWKKGLRFTDVIKSADDLKANPDINIALIVRKTDTLRQEEAVVFSPKLAWQKPLSNNNPSLQVEDQIYLFNYDTDRTEILAPLLMQLKKQAEYMQAEKTLSILGSVRFQGNYPLTNNMSISQLVTLAGGLQETAFSLSAEITRYELNENMERVISHIEVNLQTDDALLKAGDTIHIKRIPKWKEKDTISLQGEIIFPGTYTLLPGETLLDVIERAGGLTEYAFPKGSIFSRASLRSLEANRLSELKLKLRSDLSAASISESTGEASIGVDEAKALLSNLDQAKPLGRMVIDLPSIISGKNTDFQLESSDTLTIPRYKPSVTVLGEVQYPTSHFYDKKLSPHDYIKSSGGTKIHADKKRVYIVKANGRVIEPSRSLWFRPKSNQIEPGDTIIVPLNPEQVDPLTVWGKVTTIMYQAALGVSVIR